MQVQATQINNRPMGTTPVIVICTEDDITRLITSSKLLALPSGGTFIPYIDTRLTILSLFQKLCQTNTSAQQLLSGSVQIGTELSESSDLTVLSQLQLHRTGHLQIIKSVITYSYTSRLLIKSISRLKTQFRLTDVDGSWWENRVAYALIMHGVLKDLCSFVKELTQRVVKEKWQNGWVPL